VSSTVRPATTSPARGKGSEITASEQPARPAADDQLPCAGERPPGCRARAPVHDARHHPCASGRPALRRRAPALPGSRAAHGPNPVARAHLIGLAPGALRGPARLCLACPDAVALDPCASTAIRGICGWSGARAETATHEREGRPLDLEQGPSSVRNMATCSLLSRSSPSVITALRRVDP